MKDAYTLLLSKETIFNSDFDKHTEVIRKRVSHESSKNDVEFLSMINTGLNSFYDTAESVKSYMSGISEPSIKIGAVKLTDEQFSTLTVPNTIGFRVGLYEFVGLLNELVDKLDRIDFGIGEFVELEKNITILLSGLDLDYDLINYSIIEDMNKQIEQLLSKVGKDERDDVILLSKLFANKKEMEGFTKLVGKNKLDISTINKITNNVKNIDDKMSDIEYEVEDGKLVLTGLAIKHIRKSLELLAVYTTNITKVMLLVNHMYDMLVKMDKVIASTSGLFRKGNEEDEPLLVQDNSVQWVLSQSFNREGMDMRDLDTYLSSCKRFLIGMKVLTPESISFLNGISKPLLDKSIRRLEEPVEPYSKRLIHNIVVFGKLVDDFNDTLQQLSKDDALDEEKHLLALPTNVGQPFSVGYEGKNVMDTLFALSNVRSKINTLRNNALFNKSYEVERGPFPIEDNLRNNNLISYISKVIRLHNTFHANILPLDTMINKLLELIITDIMKDDEGV